MVHTPYILDESCSKFQRHLIGYQVILLNCLIIADRSLSNETFGPYGQIFDVLLSHLFACV